MISRWFTLCASTRPHRGIRSQPTGHIRTPNKGARSYLPTADGPFLAAQSSLAPHLYVLSGRLPTVTGKQGPIPIFCSTPNMASSSAQHCCRPCRQWGGKEDDMYNSKRSLINHLRMTPKCTNSIVKSNLTPHPSPSPALLCPPVPPQLRADPLPSQQEDSCAH